MSKFFNILLLAIVICGILVLSAQAETKKIDGDRLERGAKNIALGWTDIPDSIVSVTKETNNPLLGITLGLVKGVLNTFARTASGAVDVITCPANPKVEGAAIKPSMINEGSAK